MKPKLIIVLLICFQGINICKAQRSDTLQYHTKLNDIVNGVQNNQLTISPLAFLDPEGAVQIGYCRRIRDQISWQHDLGYIFYNPYQKITSENLSKHPQGFIYKTMLKGFIFSTGTLINGIYFGPEVSYRYVTYNDITDNNGKHPWKLTTGSHLNLGYTKTFNHFVIDFSGGLGARGRDIHGDVNGYKSTEMKFSGTFSFRVGWGF